MSFLSVAIIAVSCVLSGEEADGCLQEYLLNNEGQVQGQVAGVQTEQQVQPPVFTGQSTDVVLTAQSALVWDETTGAILYEKNAYERRPVASLSKLLSVLVVRDQLNTTDLVEIPPVVREVQRQGVDVRLPIGGHASVYDLLAAGLIASANDALVTLAVAASGSEAAFVEQANEFARSNALFNTHIRNATGLSGGEQYSTAIDIKGLFQLAYRDQVLRNLMVSENGVLRTREGQVRHYKSTNKLLGTYFPVLAAKTGYTREAGENLVIMTYGDLGQRLGAVVLGSEGRFQDMKTLVEWVKRNYTWY
ncbi:MAG: hypothetical protein ABIH36_01245 [bacterium]